MTRRANVRLGPGLILWREFGRLRRRPSLWLLSVLVPIGLMTLLSGVFGTGMATRLPVGVLDRDDSELSRQIIRMVDAAPETTVAIRVGDLAQGRERILDGRIIGLLMLPQNFQRDVLARRQPEVVYFYNAQIMTTGNLGLRGVSGALATASAGMQISLRTALGQSTDEATAALNPIPIDTHPLFNPTLIPPPI